MDQELKRLHVTPFLKSLRNLIVKAGSVTIPAKDKPEVMHTKHWFYIRSVIPAYLYKTCAFVIVLSIFYWGVTIVIAKNLGYI